MHLQYNNTYFDVIRRILYNEVEDMYSYDSAMLTAVAGMLGVIVVAMIVWIIIAVIANWRIFTNARSLESDQVKRISCTTPNF